VEGKRVSIDWMRSFVTDWWWPYPLRTHGFHSNIQTPVDLHHVACDLAHRDGCLYAAGDGVDARGELQEVQLFVLLADGVAGVDAGNVVVALLHSLVCERQCRDMGVGIDGAHLFQLRLLRLLLFPGLERLSVQRLGGELLGVSVLIISGDMSKPTLRLKSAFSRPDMMCS